MGALRRAWLTFRQLKTWIQVVIVLVVIGLFGAVGGGTSTEPSSNPSAKVEPTDDATQVEAEPTVSAPAVSDAEFKSALSKMRIKKDEVRNLKFYHDKSSPQYRNRNAFELYVGQDSSSEPWLRFNIQYYGDEWLFIESYFVNVDGETYKITPNFGEVERDNDSDVWEWYDVNASDENIEMIQKIIKSKKTIVRLEGRQYYKDVIITQTQKVALKNVLTVYQGLGGRI